MKSQSMKIQASRCVVLVDKMFGPGTILGMLLLSFLAAMPGSVRAGAGLMPDIHLKPDFRKYVVVKEDLLKGRPVYQFSQHGERLLRYIDAHGESRLARLEAVQDPDRAGRYWLLTDGGNDQVEIRTYVVRPSSYRRRSKSDIHFPIFPKKLALNYFEEQTLSGQTLSGAWSAYDEDLTRAVSSSGCADQDWLAILLAHGATYNGVFRDVHASRAMFSDGCDEYFHHQVLAHPALEKDTLFQALVLAMANPAARLHYETLMANLNRSGHLPGERFRDGEWLASAVNVTRYISELHCKAEYLNELFQRGAALPRLPDAGEVANNLSEQICGGILAAYASRDTDFPRKALYGKLIDRAAQESDNGLRDQHLALMRLWLDGLGVPESADEQAWLIDRALDRRVPEAISLFGQGGADLDGSRDAQGNTLLYRAVRDGDVITAVALVRGGARIDLANTAGDTSMMLAERGYRKERARLERHGDNHFTPEFYQAWLYPFFVMLDELDYQAYVHLSPSLRAERVREVQTMIEGLSDEWGAKRDLTQAQVGLLLARYPFCADCLRARGAVYRLEGDCRLAHEDFASARLLSAPDSYSIAREMRALSQCGVAYRQYDPNSRYAKHWGKHAVKARSNTEWVPDVGWVHDLPPEDAIRP